MNENINISGENATTYNDVFYTMLRDCSKLVIPVINEMFDENYTGDEEIRFRQNEFSNGEQHEQKVRAITDSSFQIIGETTKSYLLEYQSTLESNLLMRLFGHAAQTAIASRTIHGNRMIEEIPYSAVLLLHSTENTPNVMTIEMRVRGKNVDFNVPVMKVKDYTIDEIFEKKLFFLIPFYIFNYESQFEKKEEQGGRLKGLMKDYQRIFDSLDEAAEKGLISAFMRKMIIEMSNKVLEKIAVKYGKVMEGVKSIMGGKVLEYEAKDILNEGRAEGRAEGEQKKAKEMAVELYKNGVSVPVIATAASVSVDIINKWLGIQPA